MLYLLFTLLYFAFSIVTNSGNALIGTVPLNMSRKWKLGELLLLKEKFSWNISQPHYKKSKSRGHGKYVSIENKTKKIIIHQSSG